MQIYTIKKKEININNPNTFLVEDEVAPEHVQFIINDASVIENVEQLEFFLQYKNKLGEHGIEILTSTYENGAVTLDWYPSKEFTKESGKTEIQIYGLVGLYSHTLDATFKSDKIYYVLNGEVYEKITPTAGDSVSDYETEHGTLVYEYIVNTRWSTIKTSVNLPENIRGVDLVYYDSSKFEQVLQSIYTSESNAKTYSETAKDAKTDAISAKGLAENARDLAQGFASDALDAKALAQGFATDADNARISSVSETISPDDGGTNVITFTYKDGTVKTFTVTNGRAGSPFAIYRTYASIADMIADFANVPEGKFVIITSTSEDPDNAKLYVRGSSAFTFITDLSGAQGIKGEDGEAATVTVGTVTTGQAGSSATVTNVGTSSAAVLNFTIPRGDTGDAGISSTTLTIATSDWSNKTCTKNVAGMTSSKIVVIAPAPASIEEFIDSGVWCTGQGTGTLTFTCNDTPSTSLTVNVVSYTI